MPDVSYLPSQIGPFLQAHRCLRSDSALLQAFQNGTRTPFSPNATENWSSTITKSLTYILSSTASTVEPFTMGMRSIDFNYFSPFAAFLVYNVALVTTDRLLKGLDANDGLARLRTLRKFLKIVSQRWLCGGKLDKVFQELLKLTQSLHRALPQAA